MLSSLRWLTVAPGIALSLLLALPAQARQQSPTTAPPAATPMMLPSDHFSYDAIRRLGQAGLIEGYPEGTDVVQSRILTRYEMATLVARHLTRLGNLARLPEAERPKIPAELLRLTRRLAEEFRAELVAIGVDLKGTVARLHDIAQLADVPLDPKEITAAQQYFSQYIDTLRKGDEASALLSRLQGRVSGYFQFRYDQLMGPSSLFKGAGSGGTGPRPSTGGPAVGGPRTGMEVRRGRIKFNDRFTDRDEFTIQLDVPTNAAPNLRDAYVRVYNFPAKNFVMRFGQYSFPYGFEYIVSSRYRETPERALGYSDSTQASFIYKSSTSSTGGVVTPGSILPFFYNQDRDMGVELAWAAPKRKNAFNPRASLNLIQGEGRSGSGQSALNDSYDLTGSVEISRPRGPEETSLGLSFYNGTLAVRSAPPDEKGAVAPFRNAKRAFGGLYARYKNAHTELRGEYSGGLYEVTPDRALFLDNNRFNAWYLVVRQKVAPVVEIYAKYDEFNPIPYGAVVAGVKGSDLAAHTVQIGTMWYATKGTRFRVNYEQALSAYDPSAPAGSDLRKKLGLLQIDVQQIF